MQVPELNPAEMISILITAIAAFMDVKSHRIPNPLTVPAILAGVLLNGFGLVELGPIAAFAGLGWKSSLYGAATGFGLTLVVSLLSRGGGGDIKLATALGALLGPQKAFVLLAATFISACVGSVSYFILRDGVILTLRLLTTPPFDSKNSRKRNSPAKKNADSIAIPMGPFFFVGTIFVVVMKHL